MCPSGLAQHGQRGARGGEGVLVGHGMAAFKVAETPVAFERQLVGAADSAQPLAALHAFKQSLQHGTGGLAQRNHKDALVGREIDGRGSAAVGHQPVEGIALEAQAPVESRRNIARFQRAGKDLSGCGVQRFERYVAGGSHGSCSFSHSAIARCIAAS